LAKKALLERSSAVLPQQDFGFQRAERPVRGPGKAGRPTGITVSAGSDPVGGDVKR
jgi:hypothetical protein